MTWLAYTIAVAIACLNLLALVYVGKRQNITYYLLVFSTIVGVNLAYLGQSVAKTTEAAVMANKLSCLDAAFLPIFLMICMLHICGIKIYDRAVTVSLTGGFVMFVIACSGGYTDFYLRDAYIEIENGYTYLAKDFGPGHMLVVGSMVIYMIVQLVLVWYAMTHKKTVSYVYAIAIAMVTLFSIVTFAVESALNLRIELLPFVYDLMEVILLFVVYRMGMYDTTKMMEDTWETSKGQGVIILGTDMTFIGCNEAARLYVPQLNDMAIDRPINDELFQTEFSSWIQNSKKEEVEPKLVPVKDGILKITVAPVYRNGKGRHVGYVVFVSDDTKQQRYIQELNELNVRLEEMAKEADAASLAKSQFLSSMSHEIRTPINAVLGMNEMIMQEADQDSIKGYARDVKGAGQMLLSLINDILDFSKIESGKMELVENKYQVTQVMHDLVVLISARIGDKNLEFYHHLDEKLPCLLRGDETKLRQITINLLTNAVKYTEKGSIKLEIGLEKIEEIPLKETANQETAADGVTSNSGKQRKLAHLRISVSDTGQGITEENMSKLFESFARIDEKKNRTIEGTGLGLAITKSYVTMMGGTIHVDSEYGKGSTFTVILPMEIVDETPVGGQSYQQEAIVSEEKASHDYQGATILAVDDVKMNLKVFTLFLKNDNIQVETAPGGAEALALCKEKHYDMIFLDHMMPGMDGIECFHHIRGDEDSLNKDIPVVMLTANAIAGASEEYAAEGFTGYLSKPFTPEKLYEMLDRHLVVDL